MIQPLLMGYKLRFSALVFLNPFIYSMGILQDQGISPPPKQMIFNPKIQPFRVRCSFLKPGGDPSFTTFDPV